jgi:TIR domain
MKDRPTNKYDFDVFVSHAPEDNEGDSQGWVTKFIHDLENGLSTRVAYAPKIFWDQRRRSVGDSDPERNLPFLRKSALFLPILSPAWKVSQPCMSEFWEFFATTATNRIIKILKSDIRYGPLDFNMEFRFFPEGESDDTWEAEYERRINALGGEVRLLLDSLYKGSPANTQSEGEMEVFLCHSSNDKPAVRALCQKLKEEGFAPWLDEKQLLPGQKWEREISNAIGRAGAIIVCLSSGSVNKEGFLQREIRLVIDRAAEIPEEQIFLIPGRLEECVVPSPLKRFQWVDLFDPSGFPRLVQALRVRATVLEERRSQTSSIDENLS